MKTIFTLIHVLFLSIAAVSAQNSYINNHSFEATNWQSIAWFSQTNTGSPIIVDQTDPFFAKDHIHAHTGNKFAYFGGIQNAGGLYEASLIQEFSIPFAGNANFTLYYRYVRESTDPGSYVRILVDGNVIWSIAPHFIVDASEDYELKTFDLGYLETGNHVIQIEGYENPLGGDTPMQFTFDDFILQTSATASINDESNLQINTICTPGNILIETNEAIQSEVMIELVDISGKMVSSAVTCFDNTYSLSVPNDRSGIYILNLKTTNKTYSKKIFIQN